MKKEQIQEYTRKVAEASRSGLVVITYDIIMSELQNAREYEENREEAQMVKSLKSAQRFVTNLMGSLDYHYAISLELLSLYRYVNQVLVTSIVKKNTEGLSGAEDVLQKLREAFDGVSKQDHSGAVMQNTQRVVAGLTYGRGQLTETCLGNGAENRGIIA